MPNTALIRKPATQISLIYNSTFEAYDHTYDIPCVFYLNHLSSVNITCCNYGLTRVNQESSKRCCEVQLMAQDFCCRFAQSISIYKAVSTHRLYDDALSEIYLISQ